MALWTLGAFVVGFLLARWLRKVTTCQHDWVYPGFDLPSNRGYTLCATCHRVQIGGSDAWVSMKQAQGLLAGAWLAGRSPEHRS